MPSVQEALRPNMEDDGLFAQLAVGCFLSVQSTPITCFREIGSTLWVQELPEPLLSERKLSSTSDCCPSRSSFGGRQGDLEFLLLFLKFSSQESW